MGQLKVGLARTRWAIQSASQLAKLTRVVRNLGYRNVRPPERDCIHVAGQTVRTIWVRTENSRASRVESRHLDVRAGSESFQQELEFIYTETLNVQLIGQ